jgi:hypothetical protein
MSRYERGFRARHEPVAAAAPTDAGGEGKPSTDLADQPPPVVDPIAALQPVPVAPSVGALEVGATLLELTFTSSNIQGAKLDAATGIVTVSFTNGSTYRFANFTAELMKAWQAAKSAGQWFHHNVRTRATAHPVVDSNVAAAGEG